MTTLESAARVLTLLSEDGSELTVTDLVRRLGMPKSNASRLLRAMRDTGFLETVGDSKRYRPSLMLVDVGRVYRRSSSLLSRCYAAVQRVSQSCGHTGYVSRRVGAQIVPLLDYEGTMPLRVVSSVGGRLPAFASATGRALLARLADQDVAELYPDGLPHAPSANSPGDLEQLFARLDEVRSSGIATSFDEASRGVAAVSVAVGEEESSDEFALCIVLPAATSHAEERSAIARALHASAAEIATISRDKKFRPLPDRRRTAE